MTNKELKNQVEKIIEENHENYEDHTPFYVKIGCFVFITLVFLWLFMAIFMMWAMH